MACQDKSRTSSLVSFNGGRLIDVFDWRHPVGRLHGVIPDADLQRSWAVLSCLEFAIESP